MPMSVFSEPSSSLALPRPAPLQAHIPQFALPMLTMFAMALGFAAGQWAATPDTQAEMEPALALLLRFMALIKLATAVALAALAYWRLGRPASRTAALGFCAASMLMALAPGFIWSLGHIGLGAGLFHAGLALFLILCWRDHELMRRTVRR
jgi:hypothetical protein